MKHVNELYLAQKGPDRTVEFLLEQFYNHVNRAERSCGTERDRSLEAAYKAYFKVLPEDCNSYQNVRLSFLEDKLKNLLTSVLK